MTGQPVAEQRVEPASSAARCSRPYVSTATRGYRHAGFAPGEHMGLPSRHLTFIVQFDAPLELADGPRRQSRPQRFDALLGGFHTTPAVIRHDGNQHGDPAARHAGRGPGAVRHPGRRARRRRRAARRGVGRDGRELVERLAERRRRGGARFAVLDRVLLRARPPVAPRCRRRSRPETAEAWRRLVTTDGRIDVRAVAAEVGWSRRHLSDQFARRVRRRPEGDGAGAALRALEAAVHRPGRRDAGRRSPPSAATPTRPTWRASGGRSPGPARRSGWPPSSCPSATPTDVLPAWPAA